MIKGPDFIPRFLGGVIVFLFLYAVSGAAFAQEIDPSQIQVPEGLLTNGGEGGLSGSVILLLVLYYSSESGARYRHDGDLSAIHDHRLLIPEAGDWRSNRRRPTC